MLTLQQIRAQQVLEEENLNLPIRIKHAEDVMTQIGDRKFKIIFPKYFLNYDTSVKDINLLFIGNMTASRKLFLDKFKNKATIISSRNGRNPDIKSFDESYYKQMSRAKFCLCPNGSFIWTYRFFESAIFKAIPIIEDYCDLYEDYKFYTAEDKFIYREDYVNHNLNKVKREMFW